MSLPMPPQLVALWLLALVLVVLGLPLLDARSRRSITGGGRVDFPPLRPGPRPLRRPAHVELSPTPVDTHVSKLPDPPFELFREDDPLYRAIRAGLPLGTPDEHAVTMSVLRRVRPIADRKPE